MSMNKSFHPEAWDDYLYFADTDRKTLRKINALLKEIERSPHDGTGQPEPLRHELSGWWSRRIDQKNRLVYRIVEDRIEILTMRGHYGDR
jgi:toxin YoeB